MKLHSTGPAALHLTSIAEAGSSLAKRLEVGFQEISEALADLTPGWSFAPERAQRWCAPVVSEEAA